MTNRKPGIPCQLCDHVERDWLGDHLLEAHGLTVTAYLERCPGAPIATQRLLDRWDWEVPGTLRRAQPPTPSDLTLTVAGVPFAVNPLVPASACLKMPEHYRLPEHGDLGADIQHAIIELREFMELEKEESSIYIYGEPGCGKDALFHYLSAACRIPAIRRQIKPRVDIQSWFYSREITPDKGTGWAEGPILRALRDGYVVRDAQGKAVARVPYMILFTDFDRAEPSQAEHLRLITDSIEGAVEGPDGVVPVLPGTIIGATGNTAGMGDQRGRCLVNLMDASIMDRWDAVFKFHALDWRDERPVLEAKFPGLLQKAPGLFDKMGSITEILREAVETRALHAEFSHRATVQILRHCRNTLRWHTRKGVPSDLLVQGLRIWLDRLGNEETELKARKLIDPHTGILGTASPADGSPADGTIPGF